MNYLAVSTTRIAVGVMIILSVGCSGISVSSAETAVVSNGAGTLTQLQLLLAALQNLQIQLAQLQSAEPAATVAATASSSATSTAYDIIIVAGQSNAVGFGNGAYTEAPRFLAATNTAKVFQVGRFFRHDMRIIPVTHEPLEFWGMDLTFSSTTLDHHGASYPFALRLAATETTGRKVLIIPAAKAGTSILEWDNVINNFGSSTGPDSTVLYDDMIARTKFALAQNSQNRVVAVIWRQGEADVNALYIAANPYHKFMTSSSTYQSKLMALRTRLRNDLLSQGCVPFLFGEMTKQWVPSVSKYQVMSGLEAKSAITNAIKYVASTDSCNTSVFVPSTNTTVNSKGPIHFDAPGQFEMAKRFWSAYQKI